jgi:hypothetical protein
MVRPLDHATVMQQMNVADKLHQNAQSHPEISRQQAEELQRRQKILEQKRTKATEKTERSKIHLREDNKKGGGRRRKSARNKKGRRRGIDLMG